jgi:hypothetical protein
VVDSKLDSTRNPVKKPFQPVFEILSALFGRDQEFLLDDLRRRRAFGLESEFEGIVSDFIISDKNNNFY